MRYRVGTVSMPAPDPGLPVPRPGDIGAEYFGDLVPFREQFRTRWGRLLDLDVIESAIRQADAGLMRNLTDMSLETISLDTHVSALLQKRLNRVAALDWAVEAAQGPEVDAGRAEEYAAIVREQLAMIPNFRDRIVDLAWGVFHGRACSEIQWKRRGMQWAVGDLHWLHPRRLSFGPWRDLRVIDSHREFGNFVDDGFPVEAVPHKFVVYRPRIFGDYQEREGLARRAMYWSFFMRFGTREQLVLMEIFGKPWRIMMPKTPANGRAAWNAKTLQSGFEALNSLGYHNTAQMPPDVEVMVPQPTQGAGKVHADVIDHAEKMLSKLIVGSTATTDAVSTGLGSSVGDVHLTEEDLIIATDARRLAEAIEDQLTDSIVAVNFGEGAVGHAPKFTLRTDPPKDRKTEGELVVQALDAGLEVGLADAREKFGVQEVAAGEPFLKKTPRNLNGQVPPYLPQTETVYPDGHAPPQGQIVDIPRVEGAFPVGERPPVVDPNAAPGLGSSGPTPPPGPSGPEPPPPPAAPTTAADGPPAPDDDADMQAFVDAMNAGGFAKCEHGRKNRCRDCGIERVRAFELDDDGKPRVGEDGEPVFAVKWRRIPPAAAAASAGSAATTLPFAGYEDFDACVAAQRAGGHDDASARAICGRLQADAEQGRASARPARQLSLIADGGAPSEGGSHWHRVPEDRERTDVDGEHDHLFRLPDGTVVETELGGAHDHVIHDGDLGVYGGRHVHWIVLPDGTRVRTESDGEHAHDLQVTSTAQDGLHGHALVLPDGATLQSLEPRDLVGSPRAELGVVARARAEQRFGHVCCRQLQPESVFGAPDDLVARGVAAMAPVTEQLGEAIAKAVTGKTREKSIRSAIDAAARKFGAKRLAATVEPELLQGQMLGALDSDAESKTDDTVKPDTFTGMHAAIRLQDDAPGGRPLEGEGEGVERTVIPGEVDTDPRFSKREPAAAIEAFEERHVVTRDVFDEMSKAAQRRSFTVAEAATDEIVAAVKSELSNQIKRGADLRKFAEAARDRLRRAGWTPKNPSHLETVFRTNVMNAYNGGRHRQMTQPAVQALRPFIEILTVQDSRIRPTHAALHGVVVRSDDPALATSYPPFGYNCRCRARTLSRRAGEGRVVDGSVLASAVDPGFSSGTRRLL